MPTGEQPRELDAGEALRRSAAEFGRQLAVRLECGYVHALKSRGRLTPAGSDERGRVLYALDPEVDEQLDPAPPLTNAQIVERAAAAHRAFADEIQALTEQLTDAPGIRAAMYGVCAANRDGADLMIEALAGDPDEPS